MKSCVWWASSPTSSSSRERQQSMHIMLGMLYSCGHRCSWVLPYLVIPYVQHLYTWIPPPLSLVEGVDMPADKDGTQCYLEGGRSRVRWKPTRMRTWDFPKPKIGRSLPPKIGTGLQKHQGFLYLSTKYGLCLSIFQIMETKGTNQKDWNLCLICTNS